MQIFEIMCILFMELFRARRLAMHLQLHRGVIIFIQIARATRAREAQSIVD